MSDLIDRKALMDALGIDKLCVDCQYCGDRQHDGYRYCTMPSEFINACEAITDAPPAEPKKGKWECSDDTWKTAICSICKLNTFAHIDYAKKHYKFCPFCGAKMEASK